MSKFVVYFLTCAIMSIAFAPRSQPEGTQVFMY